ncbi:MAG TPA: NAD-dependent epimerase/dehydratase family protein [Pyrinomonadaceae bacterium]|nr:NAD-dependent epimerase/dehydratase family protein [Pyrinomonadaceae bacterium]
MKILIIGGTKFLGRHLVAAAQERNHKVTLFNRGKLSRENIEGVEQIYGDRNSDLDKLENRRWDAVIDTSGYLPQTVKLSAEALKDSVGQYVFISSISAYADFSQPNFDETAPIAELTEEQQKKADSIELTGDIPAYALGEMYGALKVQCERAAEKAMPGRVLNVRPGLIVGAFDPTDRFTYWTMRVAKGGEVLAPGESNRFVQLIDAGDLSEWIIKMTEQGETGIYNANSKPFELTMGKILEEIKNVSGSDAEFTWVSEDFLKQENVMAWSEMPLYLPESEEGFRGFMSANVDKALEKGLSFRPLSETIRETLNWRKTKTDEMKAGISAEKEKELLRKWRETA